MIKTTHAARPARSAVTTTKVTAQRPKLGARAAIKDQPSSPLKPAPALAIGTPATTLLAVLGSSPAILTETVWALAQETPPVIPEDIVVITTTKGRDDLDRELFTPRADWDGLTVWQALRRQILGPAADQDLRLNFHPPQVLAMRDAASGRARELPDLRSKEENAAAAEFITERVRSITGNDDRRLVASLAGGRKTMGALLHAVVSLLGRRGDRLTHVLVNDPFDAPGLQPRFFFPGQPGVGHVLMGPDKKPLPVSTADARVELTDVPFVPLSYLFKEHLGRLPGGFMDLAKTATGLVDELGQVVEVTLDRENWIASFDGEPVPLTGRDIPFFDFLFERARQQLPAFANHPAAQPIFLEFLRLWMPKYPAVNLDFGADWRKPAFLPNEDDLRKRLNSLRNRLRGAGLGHLIPRLLPPHGALGFPPNRVLILEHPANR